MTDEIDWPMTVGTLVLAVFIGWVVLAMYRPSLPVRALEGWLRSAIVARDHPSPPPSRTVR
jgi:hypothetical protein